MTLSDYQTLGRTGLRVSPLSLGTMTFGNSFLSGGDNSHETILDRYIDQGGNFLDTANAYSGGDS